MCVSGHGDLVILIVEDNPADVLFFQEAVEATGIAATLFVAGDGSETIHFLRRQGMHSGAPRPDVMVLDLNLPIRNGQEVLIEIMADPDLRSIPVAILTTSTSESSVCGLCPPGRCLYFTKTPHFQELQDIVLAIAAHASAMRSTG